MSDENYNSLDFTTPTEISAAINDSNGTASFPDSVFFKSTVILTFLAIFVVGVCANSLVVALALKPMANQPPTTINTYIINVAAADLLYIIGCLFFTLTNYNQGGWLFGDIGCRVIMSWDILTMHVSIYILTVMSIERYVAVVHPIESYKYRSISIARKVSASVWISATCLAMPIVIGMSEVTYVRNGIVKKSCRWTIADFTSFQHYMSIVFVVTFLIPSSVTAVVYTKMAFHFSRIVRPTESHVERNKPRKQPTRKVVQTLFLIIIFFWLCYIPFWINQLILLHGNMPNFDKHNTMGLITIVLSYLNSCCNPFFYTLLPQRYNVWRRIRRNSSIPKSTQKTTTRIGIRTSSVL